jgi:hypothetical protein
MRSASPIPSLVTKKSRQNSLLRTFSNDSRVSDVTFQEDTDGLVWPPFSWMMRQNI